MSAYYPNKVRQLRELLNVPKEWRLGQYIFNTFEQVDIFYLDDEDFVKKFYKNKKQNEK